VAERRRRDAPPSHWSWVWEKTSERALPAAISASDPDFAALPEQAG